MSIMSRLCLGYPLYPGHVQAIIMNFPLMDCYIYVNNPLKKDTIYPYLHTNNAAVLGC